MSRARRTMKQLNREFAQDLRAFSKEFVQNLKTTTPIDTGFARNSWRNIYSGEELGRGKPIPLARNTAEYIGVLDGQSPKGFTSRQAPRGIVMEALRKTRKR